MAGTLQAAFMNHRSFVEPLPTVSGQAYGGGFYAGQISTNGNSVATHYLIVAPKSSGESTLSFKTSNTQSPGGTSHIDGPGNSAIRNSATFPATQFCEGLTIGTYTDWYHPARNELEVCYYNLKPGTGANSTSHGINPNAVPSRASNYTSGTPAQTSATIFQEGNTEAFAAAGYWSSTSAYPYPYANAVFNQFYQGFIGTQGSINTLRVRAVRRVPV